jgi:hypothetical protein
MNSNEFQFDYQFDMKISVLFDKIEDKKKKVRSRNRKLLLNSFKNDDINFLKTEGDDLDEISKSFDESYFRKKSISYPVKPSTDFLNKFK